MPRATCMLWRKRRGNTHSEAHRRFSVPGLFSELEEEGEAWWRGSRGRWSRMIRRVLENRLVNSKVGQRSGREAEELQIRWGEEFRLGHA